jgi:hypothetical protein
MPNLIEEKKHQSKKGKGKKQKLSGSAGMHAEVRKRRLN